MRDISTIKRTNSFKNTFRQVVDFSDGTICISAESLTKEEALGVFLHEDPWIILEDIKLDWVRWSFLWECGERIACWVNRQPPQARGTKPLWYVDLTIPINRGKRFKFNEDAFKKAKESGAIF